jgi:hypothetical protein
MFQLNVPSGLVVFQLFQTDVMGITIAPTIYALSEAVKTQVETG